MTPRAARLAVLAATIALGLALRGFGLPLGLPVFLVKYGGSALWAAMVYQIVAGLAPRAAAGRSAGAAFVIAVAVEASRLIHTPALDAFRLTLPGALLLGRIFAFANIAAYALGVALAAAVDAALRPPADAGAGPAPVILFDGHCLLCAGSVQFVLRHERDDAIRFVALQSAEGRALAAAQGVDADDPDTFLFIANGRAHQKSSGALEVLARLRPPWPLARVLLLIPRPMRDAVYGLIARNRYRWFGRSDSCMAPTPQLRRRFSLPSAQ